MHVNRKDLGAVAIFGAIGLFFAIDTVRNLRIGTAVEMGPGYFPLVLSLVLLGITALILLRALSTENSAEGEWPWRGIALILSAPLVFALCIRGLGLAPTTFVVSLITAFASRRMTPIFGLALSAGIAAFCVAVFSYGIRIPVPVVGPWIRFW